MDIQVKETRTLKIKSLEDLLFYTNLDSFEILHENLEELKEILIKEGNFSIFGLMKKDENDYLKHEELIINTILNDETLQSLPVGGGPFDVKIPNSLLLDLKQKRNLKNFFNECKKIKGIGVYRPDHY
jgi:hypothetical protein